MAKQDESDAARIERLESKVKHLESDLGDALLALKELTSGATRRRKSTQRAVDGLAGSLDHIFTNVAVPNVRHRFGFRYPID